MKLTANPLQIEVQANGWGNSTPRDIRALLLNAASILNDILDHPITEVIQVRDADPCCDHTHCACVPIVHYRTPPGRGPYTIELVSRDRDWARFAFQFSHEFCHILSGYERLQNNANNWFHEAICELASIFTLRCMAVNWQTNPPYPNWADYAKSLENYIQKRMSNNNHQLPVGISFSDWLSKCEPELRVNPYLRARNTVVACRLLPLFEDDPFGWNAIRAFPSSTGSLTEYLAEWHNKVDSTYKQFVQRIASNLSVTIPVTD